MIDATFRDSSFVSLCPHPEEARSAVSKEVPESTGSSFETQTASAPQDEVSGNCSCEGAR